VEKIQEAVEATASFLLFNPEDDVVTENKNVFKKKYQYEDDQFIPRQVCLVVSSLFHDCDDEIW
jgi:hypothetical protein